MVFSFLFSLHKVLTHVANGCVLVLCLIILPHTIACFYFRPEQARWASARVSKVDAEVLRHQCMYLVMGRQILNRAETSVGLCDLNLTFLVFHYNLEFFLGLVQPQEP